ncbi:EAL domain-containing protein [Swingsia samuiensis]|uniref:EAL domain-containing protein n=1 Tax=Swingsia samuiensis TaxID=1293412 RepID=UPI0015E8D9D3|nr:EAL domain-containing protein [Swingsia samuiensis]
MDKDAEGYSGLDSSHYDVSSVGIFATNLRNRRAKQKNTLPDLQWLPRWERREGEDYTLLGAQIDISQCWLAIPRRISRSGRSQREKPYENINHELLRFAFAQAASWSSNKRLMVSFEDETFNHETVTQLCELLSESDLSASCLDVLIPESCVAQNDVRLFYYWATLRDQGARIFIKGLGKTDISLSLMWRRSIGGLLDGVLFDASVLMPTGGVGAGHSSLLDTRAVDFYLGILKTFRNLGLRIYATNIDYEAVLSFVMHAGCEEASGEMLGGVLTSAQMREKCIASKGRVSTRKRHIIRTTEGL